MNVKFSVHAVERYIERVRPGLCFGDASGELSALMEHAEVSEARSLNRWRRNRRTFHDGEAA